MAKHSTEKTKPKRRKPLGKRELSATVSYSNLWIPDKLLVAEIATKRHTTEAAVIRDALHQWAVLKRLAPDVEDGTEEAALIELQRETKKAVETLTDLLNRLLDTTSGYGDLLTLNEAQMNHLAAVTDAHYNVSAQTFAALWSLVEMFQRFYLEQTPIPQTSDPHQTAIAIRDDLRGEGLRMIQRMAQICASPLPIKMTLILPSEPE